MREFAWIAKAAELFGTRHDDVILGIGDDCAVLAPNGPTLASTDTMVAGVHFDLALISPRDAGWRAMAAALSDLAAGGVDPRRPVAALVSLQIPADLTDDALTELGLGLAAAATAHNARIVGGDTVGTPGPLAITVTVLGHTDRPIARAGARPGNAIVVTGPLGTAGVGLAALRAGRTDAEAISCAAAYRQPAARLEASPILAHHATAMIDISDGLVADLAHVCVASGVGAEVELDDLPTAADMRRTAAALGLDALELAASFGDDYELLACVHPSSVERLAHQWPGVTRIGTIVAGAGVSLTRGGRPTALPNAGFEHLK